MSTEKNVFPWVPHQRIRQTKEVNYRKSIQPFVYTHENRPLHVLPLGWFKKSKDEQKNCKQFLLPQRENLLCLSFYMTVNVISWFFNCSFLNDFVWTVFIYTAWGLSYYLCGLLLVQSSWFSFLKLVYYLCSSRELSLTLSTLLLAVNCVIWVSYLHGTKKSPLPRKDWSSTALIITSMRGHAC